MTHQCAANAEVNGGGLMCNTDGSWSGSPSCSCVAGHRLMGGNCQGIVIQNAIYVSMHDYFYLLSQLALLVPINLVALVGDAHYTLCAPVWE